MQTPSDSDTQTDVRDNLPTLVSKNYFYKNPCQNHHVNFIPENSRYPQKTT